MEKVKVFWQHEGGEEALQRKMSTWLDEQGEGIEITRVLAQGTASDSRHTLAVLIFYKKK